MTQSEVSVKALEWEAVGPSVQVARSAIGEYRITYHMAIDYHAHFDDKPVGDGPWRTDAPAKAACQADYKNRILAALVASPTPPDDVAEGITARWQREMTRRQKDRDLPDFSLPASAFPDYRTGGGGTLGSPQKCIRQDCDCFDMWNCSRSAAAPASLHPEAVRDAVLRKIIEQDCQLQEGSSGAPVIWWGTSATLANGVLKLSRDEVLSMLRTLKSGSGQ